MFVGREHAVVSNGGGAAALPGLGSTMQITFPALIPVINAPEFEFD
jgi:hypothetical protein